MSTWSYFNGTHTALPNSERLLEITFSRKKNEKTAQPIQNIPFNIQLGENEPPRLSVQYQPPGQESFAAYQNIWTSDFDFSTNETHNIALAWDTTMGTSNNKLQMWLDGQGVLEKTGLDLWTGATYPKFGIYRGEEADHDRGGHSATFDLLVYRIQISDSSLDEIAESSGLQGEHA